MKRHVILALALAVTVAWALSGVVAAKPQPSICFVGVEIKTSDANPAKPGIFPVKAVTCFPDQEVRWHVVNNFPSKSDVEVDIAFGTPDPGIAKVQKKKIKKGDVGELKLKLKGKSAFKKIADGCKPATQLCYDSNLPYNVTLDGVLAPDPDLQVTEPPSEASPRPNAAQQGAAARTGRPA